MRFALPFVLLGLTACSSGDDNICGNGEELRVCSKKTTVPGIDVSYYQGTIDWAAVKKDGKQFAIARATDGTTFVDPKFATNWQKMKSVGLIRGVYQFFHPGQDPEDQANLMLDEVAKAGGFKPGDLPPVMDMEVTDGKSNATIQANMKKWLDVVQKAIGRKPIIYTANFMSSAVGNGFTSYPLWVANYGADCPLMPSNFTQWIMWQTGSTGSVDGISGNVDLDVWNGTLDELRSFANPVEPDSGAPDSGTAHDAGHDAAVTPPQPLPSPTPDNPCK